MDDIKQFAKNQREMNTQIQTGCGNWIWHRKMYPADNEKRKMVVWVL